MHVGVIHWNYERNEWYAIKKFRFVDLREFWRTQSATSSSKMEKFATRNISNLPSFMHEVLALSHLAPNAWSFSVSCPPFFTPTHKLYPLLPHYARYIWILYQKNNKVPKLETEKFATVLSFFLIPGSLCFLITYVTLLTTSLTLPTV